MRNRASKTVPFSLEERSHVGNAINTRSHADYCIVSYKANEAECFAQIRKGHFLILMLFFYLFLARNKTLLSLI